MVVDSECIAGNFAEVATIIEGIIMGSIKKGRIINNNLIKAVGIAKGNFEIREGYLFARK
jgi:hypothetical protein